MHGYTTWIGLVNLDRSGLAGVGDGDGDGEEGLLYYTNSLYI